MTAMASSIARYVLLSGGGGGGRGGQSSSLGGYYTGCVATAESQSLSDESLSTKDGS